MIETTHPILRTRAIGQSIWLDDIHRGLLANGQLQRLIDQDGLAGVTSNPAILEQAITNHDDYDQEITNLRRASWDARRLYEHLALDDLRRAADLLLAFYRHTEGRDGMVSLEVSPEIATDTLVTLECIAALGIDLEAHDEALEPEVVQKFIDAYQRLLAALESR